MKGCMARLLSLSFSYSSDHCLSENILFSQLELTIVTDKKQMGLSQGVLQ